MPLPRCELETLLPVDERAALSGLRHEHVRHQRLLSKALLRSTLSIYVPRAPCEWIFDCNRYGRPVVLSSQLTWPLRFNLSHTETMAVCAVACDGDIGIDIETIIPGFPEDECARRFAPVERATLSSDRENHEPSRFFDYWTLKEAYLKALGLGLNGGLERVAFSFDDGLSAHVDRPAGIDAGSWCFSLLAPGMTRCAIARRLPPSGAFDLRLFRAFSDSGEGLGPWPVLASTTAIFAAR